MSSIVFTTAVYTEREFWNVESISSVASTVILSVLVLVIVVVLHVLLLVLLLLLTLSCCCWKEKAIVLGVDAVRRNMTKTRTSVSSIETTSISTIGMMKSCAASSTASDQSNSMISCHLMSPVATTIAA